MKLSSAQTRALEKFCQLGGHGFGEFAYLSRATALALARMGYIRIGTKQSGLGSALDRLSWGIATQAGYDALKADTTAFCPSIFYGDEPHYKPYGWSEWKTIPETRRRTAKQETP
jgi:hypothetical protein